MKRLSAFLLLATISATPALAEPSQCWTTTGASTRTGDLNPFPCDVTWQRDGRFSVRIGKRRIVISLHLDQAIAEAIFDDGVRRLYKLAFDEDYDVRLYGIDDYQLVFRMPADLREAIIQAVEEEQAPARRRGTLSDTPFRF